MNVKLPSGRVAKIRCRYGEESPKLDRPLPPEAVGKPFRSTKLTVTICDGENEVDKIEGMSYCNPLDRFERSEGRKKAMKRLFAQNRQKQSLGREECHLVAQTILGKKIQT